MFTFILAVVFIPTTVLLIVGMLPSMVAAAFDGSSRKSLGISVGSMNLAGCFPFVLDLWTTNHTIEQTFQILSDPLTIVIMYLAAAGGYVIDWAVTGTVSIFMAERGRARIQEIEKTHEELKKRWGPEVAGNMKLDDDGFPLDDADNEGEKEEENIS